MSESLNTKKLQYKSQDFVLEGEKTQEKPLEKSKGVQKPSLSMKERMKLKKLNKNSSSFVPTAKKV